MNYQYLNQGINIFYEEIFMIKKTKHLFLLSFLFVELLSYGAVDETFHYLKKDFFSQFNLGELKKISSCKIIKKFKELERIFLQFKDEDLISFIEKLDTEPYCSKNILLSTCYDSQEILFSFFEKAVEKIEKGSEDFGYIPFELPNLIEEREDNGPKEIETELAKSVKAEAENSKVSIRSLRKEANEEIKEYAKDGLSEDSAKDGEDSIQNKINAGIKRVEDLIEIKEAEIMKI